MSMTRFWMNAMVISFEENMYNKIRIFGRNVRADEEIG